MLIRGNALHLPLADRCVQTCVTSPPYSAAQTGPSSANKSTSATTTAVESAASTAGAKRSNATTSDSGELATIIRKITSSPFVSPVMRAFTDSPNVVQSIAEAWHRSWAVEARPLEAHALWVGRDVV